jgi:hypothetical protein
MTSGCFNKGRPSLSAEQVTISFLGTEVISV